MIPLFFMVFLFGLYDVHSKKPSSPDEARFLAQLISFDERSMHYGAGNRPGSATNTHSCGNIRGVPNYLRDSSQMYPRGLSTFYQKYTEAYGIPVVSSNSVGDSALQRACYVLRFMLADRYDVRNAFYKSGGRVALIGINEDTTSIPEHSYLGSSWNQRARGLGGTRALPVSTAGEENALCLSNDRYQSEDINLHEYVHGLHLLGANVAISGFQSRLTALYNSAKSTGKWANTYSMSTVQEYWAEGVQSYFNANRHSAQPDGVAGPISNRNALKNYDPGLYDIIREVFPCDNEYIKRCTKSRSAEANQKLKMNCKGGGGYEGTGNGGSENGGVENGGRQKGRRGKKGTSKNPITSVTAPTTHASISSGCVDMDRDCKLWSQQNFCSNHYVQRNCRKSCKTCNTGGNCLDNNHSCAAWASRGECGINPTYMLANCRKSCRVC